MKRFTQHFTMILIGTLTLGASARAESESGDTELVLRVIDKTKVPLRILGPARDHVLRIYQEAGIAVEWVTESPEAFPLVSGSAHAGGLTLTVVIVSHRAADELLLNETATGVALSTNGTGVRLAYIVADRVMAEAKGAARKVVGLPRPVAEALILGHVIAHEVGHLMLPDHSHSETGLMKGNMDPNDIEDVKNGEVSFSAHESAAIRSVLVREGGLS